MVPEGEDYTVYKGSLPILFFFLFKQLNPILYFRIKKNTEKFFGENWILFMKPDMREKSHEGLMLHHSYSTLFYWEWGATCFRELAI